MAKGITVNYKDFTKSALAQVERLHDQILRGLAFAGEKAVEYARERHANDYGNVTGNLRSSIGYVILDDGVPFLGGKFVQVKDGAQGVSDGEQLLSRLTSRYPKGLVLIVCAGMNYASYVESRGYDVLTGAELVARRLVDELIRKPMKIA